MSKGDKCIVDNCKNICKSGVACEMHRARMMYHGSYNYSPNWNNLKKGMPCITKYGYYRVNINGKRFLQHRYIMEQIIGRKLKKNEVVHHINGNKLDNRPENLELITDQSEHIHSKHPNIKKKIFIDWSKYNIPKKTDRWHPHKNRICVFDGCNNPIKHFTLCKKHYHTYWRHINNK